MDTTPKSILAMGLTAGNDDTGSNWNAEAIKAAAKAQFEACNKAGFEMTPFLFDATGDPAATLAKAKDLLRNKEGGFDGVAFGYGIRGTPELNDLFEELINVVFTDGVIGGKTPRIVFLLKPTDALERFQKAFGTQ